MEEIKKKAEIDEAVLINARVLLNLINIFETDFEDIAEVLEITNSTDMEEAIPKIRKRFKGK